MQDKICDTACQNRHGRSQQQTRYPQTDRITDSTNTRERPTRESRAIQDSINSDEEQGDPVSARMRAAPPGDPKKIASRDQERNRTNEAERVPGPGIARPRKHGPQPPARDETGEKYEPDDSSFARHITR